MAAAPFGVVSGQGSVTGERDTSSRGHVRQGKYLLLMPSCVIFKRMLRDGGPLNEGMWLLLAGTMALGLVRGLSHP